MVDPITIKQNDTYPPVYFDISDANGPVDLTGCEVNIWFRSGPDGIPWSGTCDVLDQTEFPGKVKYSWAEVDTATVGVFQYEIACTLPDGEGRFTVPTPKYLTMKVVDDINPGDE